MLKFMTSLILICNMHFYRLIHKKADLAEQLLAAKTLFLQ